MAATEVLTVEQAFAVVDHWQGYEGEARAAAVAAGDGEKLEWWGKRGLPDTPTGHTWFAAHKELAVARNQAGAAVQRSDMSERDQAIHTATLMVGAEDRNEARSVVETTLLGLEEQFASDARIFSYHETGHTAVFIQQAEPGLRYKIEDGDLDLRAGDAYQGVDFKPPVAKLQVIATTTSIKADHRVGSIVLPLHPRPHTLGRVESSEEGFIPGLDADAYFKVGQAEFSTFHDNLPAWLPEHMFFITGLIAGVNVKLGNPLSSEQKATIREGLVEAAGKQARGVVGATATELIFRPASSRNEVSSMDLTQQPGFILRRLCEATELELDDLEQAVRSAAYTERDDIMHHRTTGETIGEQFGRVNLLLQGGLKVLMEQLKA